MDRICRGIQTALYLRHVTGMETGAFGRARGERGATAVENWSFRS